MENFIRVALPVPLRKLFDYQCGSRRPPVGTRVLVPFGSRQLIGWVVEHPQQPDIAAQKLKSMLSAIDETPIVSTHVWQLLLKTARYYHHSLGETIATAMPNRLNQGEVAQIAPEITWRITDKANDWDNKLSSRAVRLRTAMTLISKTVQGINEAQLKAAETSSSTLKKLSEKGWITYQEEPPKPRKVAIGQSLDLNEEQKLAVNHINECIGFSPIVLAGVTGSGKTEVYLQAIEKVLRADKQVLILVPEIGLTPQTVGRFEQRFPNLVGLLHSQLTDKQRLSTWLKARDGLIKIVIGTRSAIFTPFTELGLIIVDEEHDLSYKQQDSLRYSSRDLAVIRAQQEDLPVVLGSATPSLETLKNALDGRYQQLNLEQRATGQPLPQLSLIDSRAQPVQQGFTQSLLKQMQRHLSAGNQVLVFINRRGFAPVWLCHRCGWIADCHRCDSYMTLHQSSAEQTTGYLQCHHCGSYQKLTPSCSKCQSEQMLPIGQGTERVEQFLAEKFSNFSIQRIDRDSTRKKQAMQQYVAAAKSGETKILVGTQMLAKGHHFPKVSLVAILDIDGALFSSDFRAQERAAQLITQVAGRAGRSQTQEDGQVRGEVLIQTHHPDHPLLRSLLNNDYPSLARQLFNERQVAQLAPVTYMALFRAESNNKNTANEFLMHIANHLRATQYSIELLGPVQSSISKKSGRYRFQLLLNCSQRAMLHSAVRQILPLIEKQPNANSVRWSLDIDPQDLL